MTPMRPSNWRKRRRGRLTKSPLKLGGRLKRRTSSQNLILLFPLWLKRSQESEFNHVEFPRGDDIAYVGLPSFGLDSSLLGPACAGPGGYFRGLGPSANRGFGPKRGLFAGRRIP